MKLLLNNKFILFLILLNSLVIFFSGFSFSVRYIPIINILDNLFTLIFLIELIVKIKESGISEFFKDRWNIFDATLIFLSVPALCAFIFSFESKDLSFLLVFRVLRVLKTFRFLKFISGVDHIINGVGRALKASVLVFLAFLVYIFIIGTLSYFLFGNSSEVYFGNPLLSLYSTLKMFTVEGWYEIPEEVVVEMSMMSMLFTYAYFIFVVFSGGIFGLSIVNSIFVDAMVSDNNNDLEEKIERLEEKIDELLKK